MDYYRPSLPILPFYRPNNETEPQASQVEELNPVVDSNYYKQILIIGKQESDPKIIRKLKDIQQDKTKYPEFHFVITQYNKILGGTPINRAIANTKSIVIKINKENEGRTERRLNHLLRDLKREHGELPVRYINNPYKPTIYVWVADKRMAKKVEELAKIAFAETIFYNSYNLVFWSDIKTIPKVKNKYSDYNIIGLCYIVKYHEFFTP